MVLEYTESEGGNLNLHVMLCMNECIISHSVKENICYHNYWLVRRTVFMTLLQWCKKSSAKMYYHICKDSFGSVMPAF